MFRAQRRIFSTSSQKQNLRASLSQDQINDFNSNGYCFVRNMFTPEEISILLNSIEVDSVASDKAMEMKDSNGRVSKCTLWFDQTFDSIYSMFSCNASIVNMVNQLLSSNDIKSDPYIIHSKLMFKEPKVGGKWEWHQDFGYWYQCGCYNPNSMMSMVISIDDSNIENGCLEVLDKSHKIGRIEHIAAGEQAGVDLNYMNGILNNFDKKYVEMKAGDVLFFHSNLFHSSSENLSNKWRRYMIVGFNTKNNQPWENKYSVMPPFKKINIVDDNAILNCGIKAFDENTNKVFLDHETNLQFAKED